MGRHRESSGIGWEATHYDGYYGSTSRDYAYNTWSMDDESHPDWLSGSRAGNIGGAMTMSKLTHTAQKAHVYQTYPWYSTLDAQVVPWYQFGVNLSPQGITNNGELDLIRLGATAISRSSPTNPSFSLSNAIGEFRSDGLPLLPIIHSAKDTSKALRNSGSEYLNAEFGWLPLVNDLRTFAKTVKDSNKIIRQFVKGSDSRIRRKYFFPAESDNRVFKTGDPGGVGDMRFLPTTISQTGYGVTSIDSSHELSFSGAFRYHVPTGDSFPEKMARWEAYSNKLLGTRLTPEVVWNLAPWSWAIDWFGNTGDVINNISMLGLDGLVLEYGYVTDVVKTTISMTGLFPALPGMPASVWTSRTQTSVNMRRRMATPFGFGFDFSKLSASQDAVLVALGISRSRR